MAMASAVLPALLALVSFAAAAFAQQPLMPPKGTTREDVLEYMKELNRVADAEDMADSMPKVPVTPSFRKDIPENYDFREEYTKCNLPPAKCTESPRMYSFAVAVTSTFTERYCLSKYIKQLDVAKIVKLSAQALLSCFPEGMGESEGNAERALRYFASNGIPTADCFPNMFIEEPNSGAEAEASLHQEAPARSAGGEGASDVFCPLTCVYGRSMEQHTYFPRTYYRLSGSNVLNQMYEEIYYNGPVIARMKYSRDMDAYENGVYSHFSGDFEGYFWVVVKGWGVKYNTPYWIVEMPYDEQFGNNGSMLVMRGVNESGIEEAVYAIVPDE